MEIKKVEESVEDGGECRAMNMKKFLQQRSLVFSLLTLLIVVVGVSLLIAGIALHARTCSSSGADKSGQKGGDKSEGERLSSFLTSVKSTYFQLYPHHVSKDPDVQVADIADLYRVYDPTPEAIKRRTDASRKLLRDLASLNLQKSKMRPREKKARAQLEHYLESVFGNPYEENYYAGDWMMGPNYFCWQPICSLGDDLKLNFQKGTFVPRTLSDIDEILTHIKAHAQTIEIYKSNIKLGVEAGMIRSKEDCLAGLNAFKTKYRIIADKGKIGSVEYFSKTLANTDYYEKISTADRELWKTRNGNASVEVIVKEYLVKYFGSAIKDMIDYLEHNHSRHCVPSNVASGLANLPLDRVWLDEAPTKISTTKKLPNGDILNGSKSYEMILPYFTTSKEYTAEKIYEMGIEQRERLFPKAIEIAMKITERNNASEAVTQFKLDVDDHKMFFNTTTIPEAENGEAGAKMCTSLQTAKEHCPVRYEAMMLWFEFVQSVVSFIEPKTVNMFYFTGENATTPNCPVLMVAKFNPSSGSQSFKHSDRSCSKPTQYQLPFFLTRPGPRYNAYSVAGHEARPGHHTQVQGFIEHFTAGESNDVIDWLNEETYYTAFTEGWALYAENPLLAQETDLYEGAPLQEYGMLKWQIWRALRLIIDTGLHARGMTMRESLDLFEEFAWDTTDKSSKDTIRYMSDPGQATAYMIGQLAIWRMRNKTEQMLKAAGVPFDEKEFHFQILSTGKSPLAYLSEHIDSYITCKIDMTSQTDCAEIIDPKSVVTSSDEKRADRIGTTERWRWIRRHRIEREHFE